jgi:hypothetical protein
MSKRVTTESTITDRSIAVQAFASCGAHVREHSKTKYEITVGRSTGILDLTTGQIEGDDMSFHDSDFDTLKQHYAEKSYLWTLQQKGASIHSRNVTSEGDIEIIYQVG